MSDDDPKYYNAWCQVMSTDQKPRRLLCTWHVIKNWNIQGRSKIKKQEVRENMKKEMRKILKETDPLKFIECPENAVKTIICKHIHAVALFEQRSESVLGPSTSEEGNVLCIDEPSTSQICYQDDIMVQEMNSFVRSLDEQSFNEYMVMFRKFKNDNERRNAEKCSKKRKIEKQTYYPSKK
ncbi:hypothetical protein NQ315_002853 [Exocentrus adspersus]|uniref:Protein FAR1-RELATED SEQUENCE n=1 Tax=Exocentrus adspersus TaxID=1586481 RepID=A0AAV8V5E1_9CUCU|nr:hypothetical protein NQ315_002853 [Exocentrus adspersus]